MAEVDLTAFMQASNNLERVTRDLRDQNQSTGKEIAGIIGNDLKKVTDPFVSSFQQIPGLQTLGSVGKTLFNKAFTLRKEKKEQEALRKRLRLTKDEFETLKEQKKIKDAQKEELEQLKSAAENLLGFDVENFNIGARMFVDEQGRFSGGIKKLIDGQQDMIESDLAKTRKQERGAAAREEIENENARREDQQLGIFQKISDNLSNVDVDIGSDKPKSLLGKMFGGIAGTISGIVASITVTITSLTKLFPDLKGKGGGIVRPLRLAIASVIDNIKSLPKIVGGVFKDIGRKLNLKGLKLGILMNFELIKDTLKTKFAPAIERFKSFGNFLRTKFAPVFEFLGKIKDGPIGKTAGKLLALFKVFGRFSPLAIVFAAFEGITGFVDKFRREAGENIVSRIAKSIGGGLSQIVEGFVGLPLDLLTKALGYVIGIFGENFITKKIDEFMESGGFQGFFQKNIEGLIDGFVDGVESLFNAAKDFFFGGGFVDSIKNIGQNVGGFFSNIFSGMPGSTGMTNPMLQVDTNQINENLDLASASSQPIIINNVDNSVVSGGGGGGFIPLPFPILDPNPPVGTLAAV